LNHFLLKKTYSATSTNEAVAGAVRALGAYFEH